jgi:hypothetical protein
VIQRVSIDNLARTLQEANRSHETQRMCPQQEQQEQAGAPHESHHKSWTERHFSQFLTLCCKSLTNRTSSRVSCDTDLLLRASPIGDTINSCSALDIRAAFDVDEEAGEDVMNFNNNEPIPSTRQIRTARFQIILAAALYGTSFPLIKILDDHIPVGVSLTMRFALATLVSMYWLLERPQLNWKTSRHAITQGIEVGVWVSIGFLAQAIGMVTTQANKVGNQSRDKVWIWPLKSSDLILC